MRPLRLELEGFASFRERGVVDFDGVEIFVLTGPTGAGKSSIIDAMGFALFGSVSRYDNKNVVAPAITQGATQARVRLDFAVEGREYSAVRVVRRTRAGANTAEARLELAGETLAANADELTRAVEALIGLNFEQFTKCVVLPQGDFAELLHAKASERQDLLVRLLDIGFFKRIRERARQREAVLAGESSGIKRRLTDLAGSTKDALVAAEQRLAELSGIRKRFDEEDDQLLDYQRAAAAADEEAGAARECLAALRAIGRPAGLEGLAARVPEARAAADRAQSAALSAVEDEVAAEKVRTELPDRAEMALLQQQHKRLANIDRELAPARLSAKAAAVAAEAAAEGAAALATVAAQAVTHRDLLLRSNAAYSAGHLLQAGDKCPICQEVLTAAPALTPPSGLDVAERAVREAQRESQAAGQAHSRAAEAVAVGRAAVTKLDADAAILAAELAGKRSLRAADVALAAIEVADEALAAARRARLAAATHATACLDQVTDAEATEEESWVHFRETRDTVVALGAPPARTNDLTGSWARLVEWANEAATTEERRAGTARGLSERAREDLAALLHAQRELCASAGVVVGPGKPRDVILTEAARADALAEQIRIEIAECDRLQQGLAGVEEGIAVANALVRHLQATHFERWYLDEAMSRLAQGASVRLESLSNGQYSLGLNASDFVVVDHTNADETRPIKTLSGGETFLASVALALALADEVSTMAAAGAPRLDALFLDEGFGTLDPETVETVRSVIADLATNGRMVGIVTHLRELADAVPTQFRVTKDGRTSRVERVDG